jgi:hypothetical protein
VWWSSARSILPEARAPATIHGGYQLRDHCLDWSRYGDTAWLILNLARDLFLHHA